MGTLFTLSSLMACLGQQLAMFVLSHFFYSFFDDAAQQTTPFQLI
jgi:hypothetical protein